MPTHSYYDDLPGYTRIMVQLLLGANENVDDIVSLIDISSQDIFMRDKSYKPMKTTRNDPRGDFYMIRGHVKTAEIEKLESLSYVYKLYSEDRIGLAD